MAHGGLAACWGRVCGALSVTEATVATVPVLLSTFRPFSLCPARVCERVVGGLPSPPSLLSLLMAPKGA